MHAPVADFSSLAEELGVDADELRDALRDFHDQKATDRRAAFATALADALGKSREEVEAGAREAVRHRAGQACEAAGGCARPRGRRRQAALEKVMKADRGDGEHGPEAFFERLADELGVSADAVEEAFREAAPRKFERGGRHHRGPGLSGLASALDVTPAELRNALRTLRASHDADRADHRAELAKFLAERFNLEQSTVEDALPELGGGPDGHGSVPAARAMTARVSAPASAARPRAPIPASAGRRPRPAGALRARASRTTQSPTARGRASPRSTRRCTCAGSRPPPRGPRRATRRGRARAGSG